MERRVSVLVGLVLVLTFFLFSAANAKETVLNLGVGAETQGFDTHMVGTNPSSNINSNIYDWLVMFDEDLNIRPALATSWTVSEDGTRWTFSLRKGVKFHSGVEFDATAVKKNFDRIFSGKTLRTAFFEPFLKEVKVIDKYTVQLVTKFPYGPMLANLGHPAGLIADVSVLEKGIDLKDKSLRNGGIHA